MHAFVARDDSLVNFCVCCSVCRIQDLVPDEYRKDRKIEPAIFDVSNPSRQFLHMFATAESLDTCTCLLGMRLWV